MEKENINISKNLSSITIVYFLLFLALIGFVILFATGTFKAPKVAEVKSFTQEDHNHSSANMNNLNEISQLEGLVSRNPNDLEALLKLSHLLNDSGFYEKAIINYNKYLTKDPKNVDVIIDLGVCYYQIGDYNSAIKMMESGIKINPKHQIAHFNLGIVNGAQGNINKSKEYFAKAVEINPNSDIGIKAQDLLDNH